MVSDDRVTQSRRATPFGRDLPGPIEAEEISEESLRRRHEAHDLQLRPILRFALGMLITAVVIHLLVWWMMGLWTNENLAPQPQIPPAEITPQPMLGPSVEPFPASELDILLTTQHNRLESYGWVDQEAGVVHIPIERAMQLLVERELPARTDGPTPTFGLSQAYELESEGGQVRIPANSASVGEESGVTNGSQ